MEELITLYHSNFVILWERAKEFTQQTGCSNCVADWTLRSQIFLDELRMEHPGWTTTHRQEWGLFLLEHLLHNAASMRKKEHQRYSQRSQTEEAKEVAPEYPSMRILIGATDDVITQVTEQVYWEESTLAPSILSCQQHDDCMRKVWQELS